MENEGRVILSGDTRQHGAVEAADALRAIEKYSGVRPCELTTIRRQNPELAKTMEEREVAQTIPTGGGRSAGRQVGRIL